MELHSFLYRIRDIEDLRSYFAFFNFICFIELTIKIKGRYFYQKTEYVDCFIGHGASETKTETKYALTVSKEN